MTGRETRFDRHSGKILIAFWVVAIVIGLAIFEWALTPSGDRYRAYASSKSISGPGPQRRLTLREWGPSTDYHVVPPPVRLRYPNGGIRESYDLSTDSQGFIEPALRHKRPDLNIVFMGGSTTECLYVAPENRFPHLTARKLETALNLKVNGINAARSGNNGLHSLLLLLGKVVPLRPDYVVLMHATNDIGVLSKGTYWSQKGSKRVVDVQSISFDKSIRTLTNALLPYTSDLVTRAWRPVKSLLQRSAAKAGQVSSVHTADNTPKRKVKAEEFASMLRSFVDLARAWRITPVLMTQVKVAAKLQADKESDFLARERNGVQRINPEDFATTHQYFNSIIREVASSKNVLLIDLAQAHEWSFGDVYDAIHFTDQGSKKVAEVIAAKLEGEISRGQIEPPDDPIAEN